MNTLQLSRLSTDAFNAALFAYIAAMLGYFHYLAFRREAVWRVASLVAYAGLAAHVVSVVSRGFAAGRVPWGNMYEYSSLLSLLVVGGYLLIVEAGFKVKSLGGFALAFSLLTMAIAVTFLYVGPAPLVPALNSYWIKIHVVAAIMGSSLFALGGGVLTILYLVQDRKERAEAAAPPPIMGGSTDLDAPPHFEAGADEPVGATTSRRGLLPPAAVLDRMAYRTIAFAFPIWTFAVIAGAIWAENAWSRYWGWDPKETWSLITWLIYAFYLHARLRAGWRPPQTNAVVVVGIAAILFTFLGVNQIAAFSNSLHSYAAGS